MDVFPRPALRRHQALLPLQVQEQQVQPPILALLSVLFRTRARAHPSVLSALVLVPVVDCNCC